MLGGIRLLPRVLILAKDKRTYDFFYNQLFNFLNSYIKIVDSLSNNSYEDVDLVLLSSSQLLIGRDIPIEKVLVVRRSISVEYFERIFSLPPMTKCYVVNNLKETAMEVINMLEALGFKLDMTPYYPGAKINGSEEVNKAAIVSEITEIVPKNIKNVINIGIRPIAFSSLLEIAFKFKIDLNKINIQSSNHVREVVDVAGKLYRTINNVNNLNQQLDAILNTVHDGIIATDKDGNVVQINKAAKEILNIKINDNEMIGKLGEAVFPNLGLGNNVEQENMLYTINGINLFVNRSSMKDESNNVGMVTAFQDVSKIQNVEHEIRKGLQAKGLSAQYSIKDIIGKSPKLLKVLNILKKLAKTDNTVLILGESGTGKELFAHSIHELSYRKNASFLPVNFAGLPESLAESELFGYDDGTFTGAKKGGKLGLFELAHNGTIFLDEIGDASSNIQALLLRVLQEKQVMRVGGRKLIPINVRVIAATNKDLKKLVEEGKFREDLYYRLFVLPLRIPSLKERREDIPELINYFFREYSATKVKISEEVKEKLISYQWPGNIRELISVVQYITSVMESEIITTDDLPEQFNSTVIANEQHLSEDNDVIEILQKEGDLFDFYEILNCLKQGEENRKKVGRGVIVNFLKRQNIPLSDQQVRRRMEILRDLNMIYSGNGGKGSKITDHGISVYFMIKKKLNARSSNSQQYF